MAARLTPPIRLGVVLKSAAVSKYAADLLTWSQTQDGLQLARVFVASAEARDGLARGRAGPPRRAGSPWLFRLVVALERLLLLKNRRHRDHLHTVDVRRLVPAGLVRHTTPEALPAAARDLDLLAACDVDCLAGMDAAGAARLGLVAVSTREDAAHGGCPPGFWQVYERRDVTGFAILGLGDGGAAAVLLRGAVGTQFYYLLNQASLFEKATHYLKAVLADVAASGPPPRGEATAPPRAGRCEPPNAWQSAAYLAGLFGRLTAKLSEKLRGYDIRWQVGFVHAHWRNAALAQARVIENPPRRFLADPFVIARDGRQFCFVEDYDEAQRRGSIAVYELGASGATRLGVALEENFHLSFPYLFEYAGTLYMCPETSENRDIRIYKCVEFPLRWRLERIAMSAVSAVDSMLFEHGGRWWMLTNIDPAQWGDYSLELHLFSAASPLDQHWQPHPANPLLVDASRARNGGLLKDGDRLYRVAQSMGFSRYGKQVSINEIVALDERRYVEKLVRTITPQFKPGLSGTHHFHGSDAITVFDFS